MSDFRDLCEDSGLSVGDPGAIDALIDMYCDVPDEECENCGTIMESEEEWQMDSETGEMYIESRTWYCPAFERQKTQEFEPEYGWCLPDDGRAWIGGQWYVYDIEIDDMVKAGTDAGTPRGERLRQANLRRVGGGE